MLRCELADSPGSLATLAGTIGRAGGDIQAVEVVEASEGRVLDDLLVVVEPEHGTRLLTAVEDLEGVVLVHAGPSRGHPGDAVTRLAVSLEALMTGQAPSDRALPTLIGGMLRASRAEMRDRADAPGATAKILVLDVDDRVLVVEREHRFTAVEQQRAASLVRLAMLASGIRVAS